MNLKKLQSMLSGISFFKAMKLHATALIPVILVVVMMVAGCQLTTQAPDDKTGNGTDIITNTGTDASSDAKSGDDLWVVCYHPCYQWYTKGATIPWDQLSHLVLGYLLPFKNGENQWDIKVPPQFYPGQAGWIDKAGTFIAEGKTAGKKTLCMLGGAGSNVGSNEEFWNMATSAENVQTFAANIKAFIEPIGFDGVDLDWEERLDYDGFLRLVKELRRIWPEVIITIPTSPTGNDAEGLAVCNEYVDAFMPMTYMSVMQWGGWTVPVPPTPLHAYESNPYSVEITLNKWTNAGVPASKVVMGIGGYGQVWADSNDDGRAPNSPYCSTSVPEGERYARFGDNTVSQAWVTKTLNDHPELVENWDDVGKCSYYSSPAPDNLVSTTIRTTQDIDVGLIFYETEKSMRCKYDYVNEKEMKGVMFWTLTMMKDEDNTYPILENIQGFMTAQ